MKNCYISTPHNPVPLPKELNKENTLFYPEKGMTFHQCYFTLRPTEKHIVTDMPILVSMYPRKNVFFVQDGEWVNPDCNTLGASVDIIMGEFWGIDQSIPQCTPLLMDVRKCTNMMGTPIEFNGTKFVLKK